MEEARWVRWGAALALVVVCGCVGKIQEGHGDEPNWPRPTARGSGKGITADRVLRGKVTAVDLEGGVVVVNFGRNQGLKRNTALLVHRDGRYVGTVIADALFDRLSSARYSRDMRTDPRAGDDVTTKIFGPK